MGKAENYLVHRVYYGYYDNSHAQAFFTTKAGAETFVEALNNDPLIAYVKLNIWTWQAGIEL